MYFRVTQWRPRIAQAIPMATFQTVCEAFARQASYCDGHGSPFTARLLRCLAQAMTEGEPVLHAVASWRGEPMADALPLRVAGALHALVLEGRSPGLAQCYPDGRNNSDDALQRAAIAALASNPEALAEYLASPPQTNEVGRSAVLLGGFATIAAYTGLPLRLLELGASAGLNMNWDRYRYRLGSCVMGDPSNALELAPAWQGELPPATSIEVVERSACDRSPVDVSDVVQRQRLRSYIWADQYARLQQLDAALAVAAQHPLQVVQAEADAWIAQMLAAPLPGGVATVVYHTIFWSYLSPAAQMRIASAIHAAGMNATNEAPLAWLRFEINDFQSHPRLLLSLWPGPQDLHLADAQAHGSAISWHAGTLQNLPLTAPRHGQSGTSLTIHRFGESK